MRVDEALKLFGLNNLAIESNIQQIESEPSRDCRRLQLLRGWSYDKENISKIFT